MRKGPNAPRAPRGRGRGGRTGQAHPSPEDGPIAPWPLIDRYPTVLGSQISLQTVSTIFRLAQTGYRQEYVDLLDELLEREPHGYACLAQRVINVAGGRIEIAPAKCPAGSKDEQLARTIADEVGADIHAIPNLSEAMAALLWALYYGVAAAETAWSNDGGRWRPTWLHFIHSRRLSYPDPSSWRLHIWDQGMVRAWTSFLDSPTERIFGLPVDAHPGKFVVHAPQVRADYPTREGLGRQLAFWFVLKSLGARGAAQYIERFAKPWTLAYAATQADGRPRAANDDDLRQADAVIRALGIGSLAGAVIPDSVKLQMLGPAMAAGRAGLSHNEWIDICDAQISKVVRGQTYTTQPGIHGSRASADVGQSGELRIASFDAGALAQTLRRDLVFWITKLNYPNASHLCPRVTIHVEDEPDPAERLDVAVKAAGNNVPVDADWLAEEIGLRLVPKSKAEKDDPRRMVPLSPMKPGDIQALLDPEAQRRQEADRALAQEVPETDTEDAEDDTLPARLEQPPDEEEEDES